MCVLAFLATSHLEIKCKHVLELIDANFTCDLCADLGGIDHVKIPSRMVLKQYCTSVENPGKQLNQCSLVWEELHTPNPLSRGNLQLGKKTLVWEKLHIPTNQANAASGLGYI